MTNQVAVNSVMNTPITKDEAQIMAQKYARTPEDVQKLFNLFFNKGISERHYLEAASYYRELNPKPTLY